MKRFGAIVGVLVALGGVFAPIAWDYYSKRVGLQLRLDVVTPLLTADPLLADVSVLYRGRPLRGLTRVDLLLINSGRTSIALDDVVEYPVLSFGRPGRVVAATIVQTDPVGLDPEVLTDGSGSTVTIKFKLLNPSDFVRFAVYIEDSSPGAPTARARIKGVKEIDVVNKTSEKSECRLDLAGPPIQWESYRC